MKHDIAAEGKTFYDQHLKHILEPKHTGEFVSIEPESGRYFLGKTDVEAIKKGREAMPNKKKYLVRIGFEAAYKFGGSSLRLFSRNKGNILNKNQSIRRK